MPNAAYYAVKKGNAPQQLVYDYAKRTVYAVCEQLSSQPLQASMSLYGLDGQLLAQRSISLPLTSYFSVCKAFDVPAAEGVSFLFLTLKDEQGNIVATNEYVLSDKVDTYDWSTSDWYKTEFTSFADYTPLAKLAKADVEIKDQYYRDGVLSVTLANNSDVVAFFIRLAAKDFNGNLIVPAFWSDNYISIPPRGEVTVTCALLEPPQKVTLDRW